MSTYADMLDDPIRALIEEDADTAKIVPDEVNGYDRVIPLPDVLEQMAKSYCAAIEQTDIEYEEKIFAPMRRNAKAYEGDSDRNETITVPLCKRIVNQQVAWLSTSILSKTPYITVKPLDGGSYEIPWEAATPAEIEGQEAMGPQPSFTTRMVSSDDASKLYQMYIQYKLTECIDFEQLIEDTAHAIHTGENPTWWRISYDPKVRFAKQKQFGYGGSGKGLQIVGVTETKLAAGEAVRIDHVSGYNITMPLDEPHADEQTSSWLCERTPLTNLELWEGMKSGQYDFCVPEGQKPSVDDVLAVIGFGKRENTDRDISEAQLDKYIADHPQTSHDVRTLWFFFPIRRKVDGVAKIEIRSLCATIHLPAKKILNLYVHPYWTGKRPYVSFFMRKRPHRFSGMSTTGDIAPIQRLMSSIFHLQIQNGVQQNVKVFLIRENSATWRWFGNNNNVLRPGAKIPFEETDDVNPVQLGSPVQSMSAEISFLDSQADQLTVARDYTNVPNRTAAATVAQVEEQAKMQSATVLRGMRRRISRAIEMYLQTVAQFHAYETIPFLDPDTKQIISRLIGFPKEIIERHYSFHVTATGDDDTPQARFEKFGIAGDHTDKRNEDTLKLGDILLDPAVPPPAKTLAKFLLLRREALYVEQIRTLRVDVQKFEITEEFIDRLIAEVQPPPPPAPPEGAMMPEGAMNGEGNVPPPGPPGTLPVLPPGPEGVGQPPPQPGDQGVAQQGAPPNPQPGGAPIPM